MQADTLPDLGTRAASKKHRQKWAANPTAASRAQKPDAGGTRPYICLAPKERTRLAPAATIRPRTKLPNSPDQQQTDSDHIKGLGFPYLSWATVTPSTLAKAHPVSILQIPVKRKKKLNWIKDLSQKQVHFSYRTGSQKKIP
jgi:hypothetical protein